MSKKLTNKLETKTNFPIARSKKIIHAAPQFRQIQKGARRKGLERIYTNSDETQKLEISIFSELDVADQDLLLCLLAIAKVEDRGLLVSVNSTSEDAQVLIKSLNLDGLAMLHDAIIIETTGYELLKEVNKTLGNKNYEWLEKSLDRLSKVFFKYTTLENFWSFNLMSTSGTYNNKKEIKNIQVCINPLSAQAILSDGKSDGGYVLINRNERLSLKQGGLARALHSVLSGLVDVGKTKKFNLDMLSDKVYARYDDSLSNEMRDDRRAKLKAACKEIDTVGFWRCDVEGRGVNAFLNVSRVAK